MSTASTQTYSPGERVLCYHGPLIYEAKILKAENWEEPGNELGYVGPHYFVHYKGWKQTWDEWVPAARLLKYNEQNLELQKRLKQEASKASGSSSSAGASAGGKRGVAGTKEQAGGVGGNSSRVGHGAGRKERGTKRGREEDEGAKKPEMKLNVPEVLKITLVDDWEAVTKNSQLVTLPREPTVQEILQEFKNYVLSLPKGSTNLRDPELVIPTIISGLQVYFDRSLGSNLLYRFERPQYAEIRKRYITGQNVQVGTEKEMSQVYGAEHLLRMLVSMPQMVASSTMDPESVSIVRDYVNELMQYMMKERDRLFQKEYESASSQYQNISRS